MAAGAALLRIARSTMSGLKKHAKDLLSFLVCSNRCGAVQHNGSIASSAMAGLGCATTQSASAKRASATAATAVLGCPATLFSGDPVKQRTWSNDKQMLSNERGQMMQVKGGQR
ncbi:hypothetical protein HaLaN_17657 [Haematococcus lacustris]|uniref:Uncharacterized protein n=1 Tax=Haematococcus lacustris TaxID=44745 RepID=A0A699ZLQ2_HAELA|nr:hypothetical protein HaLaN_17657 [Haematococcus lacustris]